jgi:predicted amidohydrolase
MYSDAVYLDNMNSQAPSMPLNLLLVQAQLRWEAPESNRRHLAKLIDQREEQVDLIVFPETFTTGFLGDLHTSEEGMDGPTLAWMRELARRWGAGVCGSAVINDETGRHNRFLFVSPDGELVYYDKKHLFAFAGEDQRYQAGDQRVVFEWHGWRICPQICYDLRFPAWCRNRDDYDVLLFVANWPEQRIDAWDVLLKARAIENQCYVAAVNRVGEDGHGKRYPGRSAVYDALGKSLASLGDQELCQVTRLEFTSLQKLRDSLPFQADADSFSFS